MWGENLISERQERTLGRAVGLSGLGLHSGRMANLRLLPASTGGIAFVRTDLEGRPRIDALASNVEEAARCTSLCSGGVRVHTVEHLMAALSAAGVDHVEVEIDSEELPVAGGCSRPYVDLIEEAGLIDLEKGARSFHLDRPLFYSEGRSHLVALPSEEFRISYTLDYPDCAAIHSQYYSVCVDWSSFVKEVADCRTFARYEELEALREAGLIRGGSLESAVVIKDGEFVTEGGLRFPDELARHKVLDLIGDLALIGHEVRMHVIAICSGHKANGALAKSIFNHIMME